MLCAFSGNVIFVRAFLITLFVCHAVQMCTYEIAVLNRAMPTDMIVVISRHVHCVTKNVRCRACCVARQSLAYVGVLFSNLLM